MSNDPIYQVLARRFDAIQRCNEAWREIHLNTAEKIVENHFPHGSGFDTGTTLDTEESGPERLVFRTAFHHMTEGMYDGWTEHTIIVRPSLAFGFELSITGEDRNDIKEYIGELFNEALNTEIDPKDYR